ncbi:MAG: EAL domain-containing protein [Thiotrichales bacterium]|nr:EAL domain-containing protein [Thiotrichales bacterium]
MVSNIKKRPVTTNIWLTTIIPSAVIPIAGAILFNQFLDSYRWVSEPFHSLLESVGSFAALILAFFILTMRNSDELKSSYIWVATTLMGMGLLDGFHAGISPGNEFVWLHSLATFVGGVTFALVTLPDRISSHPKVKHAPFAMAIFSVTIGLVSVFMPQLIPMMITHNEFTLMAQLLNFIGGIGFILAWFFFVKSSNIEDHLERQLLANHALLFGAAGVLFQFSVIWDATWWLWHILRLAAYLIILSFFIRIYLNKVKSIKENAKQLEEKQIELERERSLIQDIIENSPSLISLKDLKGHFILVNTPFREKFNQSNQAIYGLTAVELFDTQTAEIETQLDNQVISTNNVVEKEITLNISNKEQTFIASRFPVKNKQNEAYAIGSILTDITERKAIEKHLKLSQDIIDHTHEGILVTDHQLNITQINIAYSEITGFSLRDLVNKTPRIFQPDIHEKLFYQHLWKKLDETGHWSGEFWDFKKDGSRFPQWLSISTIYDQNKNITNYVGILHDISEIKETETKLEQLAYFDPLTKLPNRTLFKERLNQELLLCHNQKSNLAILLVDLDEFKMVNDTLGHSVGDELLKLVSQRFLQNIQDTDTVARLGGDEFIILLPFLENIERATEIAKNIIGAAKQTFTIHDQSVNISASIGIAIYPSDGDTAETLFKNADLALYKAKDTGRNTFKFFSKELQTRANEHIKLKKELQDALVNNEFDVYYQPKINLKTNQVMGMEALIRWNHPSKGLVYPDQFISFSEQSGLIIPIGQYVLNKACRETQQWSEQFNIPLHISVNLSTKQFKDKDLLHTIQQSLKESALPAHQLELEITESSVMDDVDKAIEIMNQIYQDGVQIALDDFGTGYSSLAYLKCFPIHTIKIDRSFIKDILTDPDDRAIIESVILLSEKLQIENVAEGVEQIEQLDYLKAHNCQIAQGYLFSKPLNANDFMQFLNDHISQSPLC